MNRKRESRPQIDRQEIPEQDQIDDTVTAVEGEESPEVEIAVKKTKIKKEPSKSAFKSAVKCIYFRDAQQLKDLEQLAKLYPTSSSSGLVQQLVGALLEANAKSPSQDRTVQINATIYL